MTSKNQKEDDERARSSFITCVIVVFLLGGLLGWKIGYDSGYHDALVININELKNQCSNIGAGAIQELKESVDCNGSFHLDSNTGKWNCVGELSRNCSGVVLSSEMARKLGVNIFAICTPQGFLITKLERAENKNSKL